VAQAFATSYRARFGFEPELRAASFYDGVFALKAAMDAAGGRSARDIARGMKRVARDGVTGRVDFTTSLTVSLPLELRTVTGGRPTVVPPR
jgi:branched-chain amino acid transport system substrate-binding protein